VHFFLPSNLHILCLSRFTFVFRVNSYGSFFVLSHYLHNGEDDDFEAIAENLKNSMPEGVTVRGGQGRDTYVFIVCCASGEAEKREERVLFVVCVVRVGKVKRREERGVGIGSEEGGGVSRLSRGSGASLILIPFLRMCLRSSSPPTDPEPAAG
jgi:hypothetical protein